MDSLIWSLTEVLNPAWDLGVAMAKAGSTSTDNPYTPGWRLYDGADTMGEALSWYNGWRAQVALQKSQQELKEARREPSKDGLDYLEEPRG